MNKVFFIIQGEPKGKARPRASNGHIYTPKDTVNYENWVRLCYRHANGRHLGDSPLEVKINCYVSIPKSLSVKKREKAIMGELRPTKKPDVDNIAKIILDSLNGIAYNDDKQVTSLTITKHYAEEPRVEVYINE